MAARAEGRWRRRLSGLCRWTGTALCALILLVYVPSGWYAARFEFHSAHATYSLAVGGGSISGTILDPGTAGPSGWVFRMDPDVTPWWDWWFSGYWLRDPTNGRLYGVTRVPFWVVLVVAGAPTAFLWRRNFKRRRNWSVCPCGYDLTGLPAGATCPEFGTPVGC